MDPRVSRLRRRRKPRDAAQDTACLSTTESHEMLLKIDRCLQFNEELKKGLGTVQGLRNYSLESRAGE